MAPAPAFLPGESRGQRALGVCSPRGRKVGLRTAVPRPQAPDEHWSLAGWGPTGGAGVSERSSICLAAAPHRSHAALSPLQSDQHLLTHPGLSDSVTPWTVARQAPLSLGASSREYWGGCRALLREIFPTSVSCISRQVLCCCAPGEAHK